MIVISTFNDTLLEVVETIKITATVKKYVGDNGVTCSTTVNIVDESK